MKIVNTVTILLACAGSVVATAPNKVPFSLNRKLVAVERVAQDGGRALLLFDTRTDEQVGDPIPVTSPIQGSEGTVLFLDAKTGKQVGDPVPVTSLSMQESLMREPNPPHKLETIGRRK